MKILILGGTGFLGPDIVRAAQQSKHTITLFNRGKTHADLFPDVEKLQGARRHFRRNSTVALHTALSH
jgi:2'-hydroxyisoflavone reductase